jgi:hypothetical protein
MANEQQLMVDLETLSTKHNAAILSIGACIFDPRAEIGETIDEFYLVISAESNEQAGRHFSAGTLMWWLQQSQAARDALSVDPHNLTDALTKFRLFVNKGKVNRVWANSPSFDCVILEDAMASLGMMCPWQFWDTRDVRTIKDLAVSDDGSFPNMPTGKNVAHNALDDALKQAMVVQYAYQKLGV